VFVHIYSVCTENTAKTFIGTLVRQDGQDGIPLPNLKGEIPQSYL